MGPCVCPSSVGIRCAHRGCCFCLPASRAPCGRLCASSAVSVRTAVHHHGSTFHFRAINAAARLIHLCRLVFFLGCFFTQEMKSLKFHSTLLLLYCFSQSEAFIDAFIWFDKLNQLLHLSGDFLLHRRLFAYKSDVCCSWPVWPWWVDVHVLVLHLCSLCFQHDGCHEPVIASFSSVRDLFSAHFHCAALKTNTGAIIYSYCHSDKYALQPLCVTQRNANVIWYWYG